MEKRMKIRPRRKMMRKMNEEKNEKKWGSVKSEEFLNHLRDD
jgi:hypothetical protein